MTELRSVSDYVEAVSLLEFVDVIVYESRGQRRDGGFGDLAEDTTDDEGNAPLQINVLVSDSSEVMAIRAQFTTTSANVVASYDAAVIYRKAEPIRLDPEASAAFITNVGIMTLYPFLREGVHEVSSRLGFPIKLGMLRRGDTGFQISALQPLMPKVERVDSQAGSEQINDEPDLKASPTVRKARRATKTAAPRVR